jgi:transposase
MLAGARYPAGARILLVFGTHSTHIFMEKRAFLETPQNRPELTFTPKYGSWLNLIESHFGKFAAGDPGRLP